MPNSNLENSKTNMKTRIRNRVQAGQTPRDLGRLAKSARFVGLLDDAEVETDIDTQMSAAIPTASIDELVDMSEGIAELRGGSADMGQVATTDNLTEGGNKFLKAENVQSEISVSGDLSYDNGVVSYTAPTAAALQVVATVGDLPTGASPGDQAVVQSNNNLYIRTADGWYATALINTAPSISGNDASYELASDQTPTVITLTATDPENDPVTFSHSVSSGDLNGTTVTQEDNVFTVTPHVSQPATFDLTFSADDSVNVATAVSSFSLDFTIDLSGHYSTPSNNSTYTWDSGYYTSIADYTYQSIGSGWGDGTNGIQYIIRNGAAGTLIVELGQTVALKGFIQGVGHTMQGGGCYPFTGNDRISVLNVDTGNWEIISTNPKSFMTVGPASWSATPATGYSGNPMTHNSSMWPYGEGSVNISAIKFELRGPGCNGVAQDTFFPIF